MKAIAALIVCMCFQAVGQKPPQDGAPNVSPEALASLRHGLTQQQVEDLLKARGYHQFTASFSNRVARCLSYYRDDLYGHYYLVFTNDHLARICQPPPFEMRKEPYRATWANYRVLGNPETRLASVLRAEDMIGPRLTAALKPQTSRKRSVDPGLTAAFLLDQKSADVAPQSERERKYKTLLKQYDPFEVAPGAELALVESRLGKPQVTDRVESGREIRYYGNVEFGLSASRELMWLAVVYEDGKVVRVYSHDFVDHDKIRPLEEKAR